MGAESLRDQHVCAMVTRFVKGASWVGATYGVDDGHIGNSMGTQILVPPYIDLSCSMHIHLSSDSCSLSLCYSM